MKHMFDVDIAIKYGVNVAILLEYLNFWISKNKANEKHFYDGTYWTYNSIKAFHDLFPYLSERQIMNTLNKMCELGLIKKGNYNKSSYDRTCWYALTNLGISIVQKCKMDDTKMSNQSVENVEPIPIILTDIDNSFNKSDIYSQVIDYLNEKAGTHYRSKNKETQKNIKGRIDDGYTIDDFKLVIDKMCNLWLGTTQEIYLRPSTLFRPTNFENYLNMNVVKKNQQQSNNNQETIGGEKVYTLSNGKKTTNYFVYMLDQEENGTQNDDDIIDITDIGEQF